MASSAYVRWVCRGWCLLLCAVSLTAGAATRVPVKMPSSSAVATGAGAASRVGDNVRIPGTPGTEYLPRTPNGTPGTPIKVLPTIDYSIPRTITQVKNSLKANLGQALLGAAIAGAVAGIDWVMSDDNTKLQRKGQSVDGVETSGSPSAGGFEPTFICAYMGPGIVGKITPLQYKGMLYATWVGSSTATPSGYGLFGNNCTQAGFPPGTVTRSRAIGLTDIKDTKFDLGDADWTKFDTQLNGSTADFIKQLIRESCAGSNNPEGCYNSLVSQSALTGPASVTGGQTTTTSTYTRPDGTTGTKTTESVTTFNITYGPNYFDYSKTVTNTDKQDGTVTGITTETETPTVTQEQPAEDQQEEVAASPCAGTKCDGPKYEDLYKPKEDKAEDVNRDYISRVKNIPILAATGGFFNVGGGGACPTWQTTVNIDLGFVSGSYNLNFDFFCTSTALLTYQWASYVLMLLGAWVGFRWGILE